MATETRLDRVESELEAVTARLRRLEHGSSAPVAAPPAPPPLQAPSSPPQAAPAEQPRVLATPPRQPALSALDLERLFGGRVLAWIGGLAIFFAAVLFVGMAISRGWIDEEMRTIIAAVFSFGLLGLGVWLHERHGRTEAAQAAVGAALSGLFATIVVASQAYDLIDPGIGLVLAALVAVAGFAIAVRWDAPVVAAIGSLGALAAPLLLGPGIGDDGASYSSLSLGFECLALTATVAIVLWRRWDWLALGAFALSAPQLAAWAGTHQGQEGQVSIVFLVLVGFWALYTVAAVGHDLRQHDRGPLPFSSWLLLFASCALVVGLGYSALHRLDAETAAVVWLFGFAGVYLVLGELALRLGVHRELGALSIGLGVVLSAFALGQALDGPALVAAWAAEAAVLAALSTRVDAAAVDAAPSSRERLLFLAAGFLVLAGGHTLIQEAPPTALFEGVDDLGAALAAIGACAAAALAFAHFLRRENRELATVAAFAGATAIVYLGSVAIVDTIGVDAAGEVRQAGQVWLSAFWTVTGLGAVVWGLVRRQANVRIGGLLLLGIAITKVWTYDLAELEELARVLSFVGLGLLLLAGAFAYGRIKPSGGDEETADGEAVAPGPNG